MQNTYRDMIVWQKSIELASAVYALTEKFSKEEIYGITSQMRRAAVSIPSNIAEGKLRGGLKECRHFFLISFGSGGELETQIEIAKRLPRIKSLDFENVDKLLNEVMRMLNTPIANFPSA